MACAFSSPSQDVIKKGFQRREKKMKAYGDCWQIPYLLLDPEDIGHDYQCCCQPPQQPDHSPPGAAPYP